MNIVVEHCSNMISHPEVLDQEKNRIQQFYEEWAESAIDLTTTDLNLTIVEEEQAAEWYFQYLPNSCRRNDGRIRDAFLNLYRDSLKGGWGVKGYDPDYLGEELQLRTYKPQYPRLDTKGKIIKYDFPKGGSHFPILARVSYDRAQSIFELAGIDFNELLLSRGLVRSNLNFNHECDWFWEEVLKTKAVDISITEGAKKALSLIAQGKCAIAVTSVTTWASKENKSLPHPWLAKCTSDRNIFIVFDNDSKQKTRSLVQRQIYRLGAALNRANARRVRVPIWENSYKGIDDLIYHHEQKSSGSAIKVLERIYTNALSYRLLSEKRIPGKELKISQRFLDPKLVEEQLKNCKILILKSAKGTGKTQVLAHLAQVLLETARIPVINLSYLEKLARELAERLNIPYRTAKDEFSAIERNILGYSTCIDSFHPYNSVPFHSESWQLAALFIDEFVQVLHHFIFGKTEISKYRRAVEASLSAKLYDCWRNNRPIVLSDADATPEAVELIYNLIENASDEQISREELEKQTIVLNNEYQIPKTNAYLYEETSSKGMRTNLVGRMKQGEKLMLVSSSQAPKSKDGTINLEKLARKYYPKKRILRIDRETLCDPNHAAFGLTGKEITYCLIEQKYDILICSPSICTGVSIDINNYFSAVFSFQSGHLPINSVLQQLERLRDWQCPRYIWCPRVAPSGTIASGSINPIEILTNQKRQFVGSLKLLSLNDYQSLLDSNTAPLLKFWAKGAAARNYDCWAYRKCLEDALEADGWKVIMAQGDLNDAVSQELLAKSIKAESLAERDSEIVAAPQLSEQEAEQLTKKKQLNTTQQRCLDKWRIKKKYPSLEVNTELLEADRKGLYKRLQIKYYLTVGRPYLKHRDRTLLENSSTYGNPFIPDFNNKSLVDIVEVLDILNWQQFFEDGITWTNEKDEAIAFKTLTTKYLKEINQVLRCGINIDDSPITCINKVLLIFGTKLHQIKNARKGKQRLRHYSQASSKFDETWEKQLFSVWLNSDRSLNATRLEDIGAA